MPIDEKTLHAFVERVVADLSASYGGVMVGLGSKLGLYKAMAGAGPLSSHELAKRAGCDERYVREWLNSQAAGGYVRYHPESEAYELPAEHAMVLADEDSPVFFPRRGKSPCRCGSMRTRASKPSGPGGASPGATITSGCSAEWPPFFAIRIAGR